MAKSFADTEGQAKKGGEYYKWVDGDQTLRLVGEVIPRYVYWQKTPDGKNISVECLAFDRDKEKFTNTEKDWFQEYFPDAKCSWAYVTRAIVEQDGQKKVLLIPMKKKLYQQIVDAAADLGDPTDIESGWDCVINRKKTGAHAFNVEYNLKVLKCKNRPLDDEERKLVEEMPAIDELVPRMTPTEQKEFIQNTFFNDENTHEDEEAANELARQGDNLDDDMPF